MKSFKEAKETPASPIHHTTSLHDPYLAVFYSSPSKTTETESQERLSLVIRNLCTGAIVPLEFSEENWPIDVLKIRDKFIVQTKNKDLYLFDAEINSCGKIANPFGLDLKHCNSPLRIDSMPIFGEFKKNTLTVYSLDEAKDGMKIQKQTTTSFKELDKLPFSTAKDSSQRTHDWAINQISAAYDIVQLKTRGLRVLSDFKVERLSSINFTPPKPFLNKETLPMMGVAMLDNGKTMLVTHAPRTLINGSVIHTCLVNEINSDFDQQHYENTLPGNVIAIKRAINDNWFIIQHRAGDGMFKHADYISILDYDTKLPILRPQIIKIPGEIADLHPYPDGKLYILDKNGKEYFFELIRKDQKIVAALETADTSVLPDPLLNMIAEYQGEKITVEEREHTFRRR